MADLGPKTSRTTLPCLRNVSIVGLTERFGESAECIERLTGLRFRKTLHSNRGQSAPADTSARRALEKRLVDLNEYDLKLYDRAAAILDEKVGAALAV